MTIKELREKYNLTQSALARTLGVSSNAISGIEGGRIKLSNKMSAKIKEVYGEELPSAETEKPAEAAATTPENKTTTKKTRSEKKAAPEKPAPEKPAETETTTAAPEKAAEVTAPAPEKNTTLEKAAETVAAAPKAEKKPEKKPVPKKKAAPKKSTAPKKSEENVPAAPKAEKKTPVASTVILQSPFGGEITVDAVKTLVGDVDKVYVRIDQNKLYWVKGKETGNKDIW